MKVYEKFGKKYVVEYDSPWDAITLRSKFYTWCIVFIAMFVLFFKSCEPQIRWAVFKLGDLAAAGSELIDADLQKSK